MAWVHGTERSRLEGPLNGEQPRQVYDIGQGVPVGGVGLGRKEERESGWAGMMMIAEKGRTTEEEEEWKKAPRAEKRKPLAATVHSHHPKLEPIGR